MSADPAIPDAVLQQLGREAVCQERPSRDTDDQMACAFCVRSHYGSLTARDGIARLQRTYTNADREAKGPDSCTERA